MLRSHAKPLSYIELEAFMEKIAAEAAPAAKAVTREVRAEPVPPKAPEHCPHCNGRLAALDLKFGQCLACRKPLSASGDNSRSAPVSIGI